MPAAGKIPRFSAKMITSIRPIQKTGDAARNSVTIITRLSKIVYCLIAEMIPTGMPMTTAMKTAAPARIMVFLSLWRICSDTSRLFR